MASREKANRAVERLVETTRDSYEAVLGHAATLQERNVSFARDTVEALAGEYRQQAKANRAVARELVERAAEQRYAFRTLIEESLDAYANLLYVPFSYYEEALKAAKEVAR